MVYESDDKHLKISVRMFLDDLEDALYPKTQLDLYDITDTSHWDLTQQLLSDYFRQNLRLSINNKPLELTYLGSEIEGDAMWCYLELEKLKPFDEMTVQYTVLKEIFPDQENLVHVRQDGKVKSCRIYGEINQKTLTWD